MLQLLLTPHDGGTAWRHALTADACRAGWECVGPLGLARRVARLVGASADLADAPDRLAAFAARLDADDDHRRSYSASRTSDPFGVASFLLGVRDRLKMMGWKGSPLAGSERLADLSRLEARPERLPPGLPDALGMLTGLVASAGRLPEPLTLHLAAPRAAFEPLVGSLLEALAAAGADVRDVPPDAVVAAAGTDLARLQAALLCPVAPQAELRGDGSVRLLEADTPLEAAELAADLLRQRPLDATTLLVAAEPDALDAALLRQGLPTLGVSSASALRPHLQILPLRLLLAFAPQDPFRAAELLQLPGGPLPGFARRRLLDALTEMPGLWSPAWNRALEAIADDARQHPPDGEAPEAAAEGVTARIDRWFGPPFAEARAGLPVADALALTKLVSRWLAARAGLGGEQPDEAQREQATLWAHAAAVARTLERMLISRPPAEKLPLLALMQLHALAVGGGAERAACAPEAGRPALAPRAGAVLPGAAQVVWWGFVQDVEVGAPPEAWSRPEAAALAAAGVELPEPGAARALEAWGWRRAVLSAREGVAFVRWRLSGTEVLQPHPFLDELETRVKPGALSACTASSEALLAGRVRGWSARTVEVAPAAPIFPRTLWQLDPISVDGIQSASQLRTLLGCPMQWVLQYAAGLRPGRALDLPDADQLLGSFVHALLQDLVVGPRALPLQGLTEEAAQAHVERDFDARVPSEAAPLVQRGKELELDRARRLAGRAAAALVRHLHAGDWEVTGAETELSGEFEGHPVHGYADLVLRRRSDGARAVLDLKLGGFAYKREELEKGQGLQLALYARMLGLQGGKLPPAAYLVLQEGELLAHSVHAFPGAVEAQGPSLEETLQIAGKTLELWEKGFASGHVPVAMDRTDWAERIAEVVGEVPDKKDPGRYPPGCRFCRFTVLCDVTVGTPEVSA